ncbi:MAG: DegV family protein [Clostridia bacterium]|nr:DegV family protein [Clostridia bacterium]
MAVKIVADSTCDITGELARKYDIDIIPLHVILNTETFKDGVDIKSEDVIAWSNKNNSTPKTAAPSIEAFQKVFQKYSDEKRDIVLITISSEFSGTMQSAQVAKADYKDIDIRIVDSRNLSTGIGHLVLIAAELSEKGLSAAQIESQLLDIIPKVRASFFIDTLTFLYRGGRCSALQAFGANSLKIKPQIIVEDGKMKTGSKFRGPTEKVCRHYADFVLEDLEKIDPKRVFITHSPTDTKIVDIAYEIVKSKNYFDEILITEAGCVVTSHCGASTLGILYIEK